ncbi:CD225/dispanin family protein [Frankia sp. Ag45/Mut15]|uniref:CD225/dispanin family protein n=1 Tax=Frankia umida TaxID=573489 RepID=A0ABT0JVN5_9ACTN|nr:CD225/dispanin family protein [Frankia umida]MCK9875588.1 CD225/dispanin family protein [Frankia umida]
MPVRPDPADSADHGTSADEDVFVEYGGVGEAGVPVVEVGVPVVEVGPSGEVEWERPVRTYLWQSLVATLLCCLPTGAIALVYASIAQNRLQLGDVRAARQASARARRWCIVSLITFVVVLLTYVVAVVILVAIAHDRA